MHSRRFSVSTVSTLEIGRTCIHIQPISEDSSSSIDSYLLVSYKDDQYTHRVLNLNDCQLDSQTRKTYFPSPPRIDILLQGYTGAGCFPQTYYNPSDPILPTLAENKKNYFLSRYQDNMEYFKPKVSIPFAGQYLLGSSLSPLNPYRGVADATEAPSTSVTTSVVLADHVHASIDTNTLTPSAQRLTPYSEQEITHRIAEISTFPLDHTTIFKPSFPVSNLPFRRLCATSYRTALRRYPIAESYLITFDFDIDTITIDINSSEPYIQYGTYSPDNTHRRLETARSIITISPSLFFLLLTGVFHWNNAEIGSLFTTRRQGDYSRHAQNFLDHFAVC